MSKTHVWIIVGAALLIEIVILQLTVGIGLPHFDRASATSRMAIKAVGRDVHFVTENKHFYLIDYQVDEKRAVALILRESIDIDQQLGTEGSKGLVSVEAFEDSVTNHPKWKIRQEGHIGEVFGDVLYKITNRGCCDRPATYLYFSLRDGKKVYEGNRDPTPVELTKFY